MGSLGRRLLRSRGHKRVASSNQPFDPFSFGAFQRADGKKVTVEYLHPAFYPSIAERDHLVERLRRDVALVAELEQPDFLTYDEVVVSGGRIGLVMPELFASFGSLRALPGAYGRPWLEAEVVYMIGRRLVSALGHLHEVGLLHRQLCPEAIWLLPDRGELKIRGAGVGDALAQYAPRRPNGGRLVQGSPRYLAPEQYLGPERCDGRTDLYTAGVLFYELLAGQHPTFVGEGDTPRPDAQALAETYDSLPPIGRLMPEYIDSGVERLLLRATALQPEERFQTAHEFYEALGNLWRTFASAEFLSTVGPPEPSSRVELTPLSREELERLVASGEVEPVDLDDFDWPEDPKVDRSKGSD